MYVHHKDALLNHFHYPSNSRHPVKAPSPRLLPYNQLKLTHPRFSNTAYGINTKKDVHGFITHSLVFCGLVASVLLRSESKFGSLLGFLDF